MIEIENMEVKDESEEFGATWFIENDAMADWAMEKIAERNKETDRLICLAKAKIRELEDTIVNLGLKRDRENAYLTERLREYFDGVVDKKITATQESYKLLAGTIRRKYKSEKMVKNDDALVQYLHSSGQVEFIKTEEKPAWAEFKKNLEIVDGKVVDKSSGEVVDAVTLEDVPEKFDIVF